LIVGNCTQSFHKTSAVHKNDVATSKNLEFLFFDQRKFFCKLDFRHFICKVWKSTWEPHYIACGNVEWTTALLCFLVHRGAKYSTVTHGTPYMCKKCKQMGFHEKAFAFRVVAPWNNLPDWFKDCTANKFPCRAVKSLFVAEFQRVAKSNVNNYSNYS
jgi:hypothetical protein